MSFGDGVERVLVSTTFMGELNLDGETVTREISPVRAIEIVRCDTLRREGPVLDQESKTYKYFDEDNKLALTVVEVWR